MRAFFLTKRGHSKTAFELKEVADLRPGKGEVLIKSEGFGLNFADVMARLGLYDDCPPLPTVIGYENVGHVQEIGEGVEELKVGDRVLAFTRFNGYAEQVVTPELGVAKIPDEWSVGTAAALATQYTTALFAIEEAIGKLHHGDHVLVHAAAGGVGTALVQLLKAKGCVVFGTASVVKHDYLRSIGVDYPVDYREKDYASEIEKLGYKGKLDVTFNPIGGNYVKKDYKLLNGGGCIVLFGASKLVDTKRNIFKMIKVALGFGIWSPIKFVSDSKSIVGINLLRIVDAKPEIISACLKKAVSLAKSGEIHPTVTKEFNYLELDKAHDFLASRKSMGKIAVYW